MGAGGGMKYKYTAVICICVVSLVLISGCSSPTTASSKIIVPPVHQQDVADISIKNLTVTFADVGQGDATWIVSPYGHTMLIDAGEADEVSKIMTVIDPAAYINVVVATHPHTDHIGGMETILNTYRVGQFVDTGYPHTTSVYENMLARIEEKGVSYTTVKSGDYIRFSPKVEVRVLNPQNPFVDEINDNSIVLLISYDKVKFLFTGDAERTVERQYVRTLNGVDVLKVSHHGSSTSTGPDLLAKAHPRISIISVGENSYGHPDANVIKSLENIGSKVYRTDVDGYITVTTNGKDYSVLTTAASS
jgi:beta-lactamase superfamily II metal-dependent hydrolase